MSTNPTSFRIRNNQTAVFKAISVESLMIVSKIYDDNSQINNILYNNDGSLVYKGADGTITYIAGS